MIVVGLTGGLAAGKSTVGEMLAARGARVIDADAVGHDVLDGPARSAVLAAFGDDMTTPQGGIDRRRLAALVFSDPRARSRLESITHPLIFEEIRRRIAELPPGTQVAVVEAPLLVEALQAAPGALDLDALVVVAGAEGIRLQRAMARGMDREEAARRIGAQADDAERLAAATHVVENDGDLDELEQRVEALWRALTSRR